MARVWVFTGESVACVHHVCTEPRKMGKKRPRTVAEVICNCLIYGAHDRNRTCDLFLTKEVLYRLSYVSGEVPARSFNGAGDGDRTRTISLEG